MQRISPSSPTVAQEEMVHGYGHAQDSNQRPSRLNQGYSHENSNHQNTPCNYELKKGLSSARMVL
ncbi:hypothetical protein B0H67DRAFT_588270 [Lasiosphaeris hirsuta]|uniref:Uncharacterized protein n=1 Tax=Lasiosphaeris hirsuta TaxID=260670 RepID=A0AA40DLK8_9PEZI|nr:hypothetical protein B0H67DRAFT_588270 [Lasiosphaeris hirsuta]